MKKWLVLTISLILLAIPIKTLALTTSTIYCYNENTLIENITVYKDGNISTLSLPIHCDLGCDNTLSQCIPFCLYGYYAGKCLPYCEAEYNTTTGECNIPVFQQNLYLLVVITVFFIIIGWLWSRKK